MKYFVHRYDVVRVKVAVEANNQQAAMTAADEYLATNHPLINKYSHMEGEQYPTPKWLDYETAGEVAGYLVDEVGDEDYLNSTNYDARQQPEIFVGETQDDWPREDWQFDVANNDTSLGYADWVKSQQE